MVKWNIWKKIIETISKNKTWLYEKRNAVIVLFAGATSAFILWIIHEFVIEKNQSIPPGAWNLIILIVSAPVAFVIWHFRDENNRQQIENQRKDINLKEFQKLSEWVSGAHLPEIKTVNKTTNKRNLKSNDELARLLTQPIEYTTEETEEYSKQPKTADFDTFSKRDGAVALQISAIYNLLPFFRGDYGESFRRPAFNLLKSAWQAMQQDSLKKLDETHLADEERKKIFDELTQKAKSPMGVALTQVLLSLDWDNKKLNLRDFPEMLPNICLAGMNFHLSGVSEIARDLSELDLSGADFRGARLEKTKFQKSKLGQVKLDNACLEEVSLQDSDLVSANLKETNLFKANLQGANLRKALLKDTKLVNADLRGAQFYWGYLKARKRLLDVRITANGFIENIYPDWRKENDPQWDALTESAQTQAMQKFCKETGMLIFDDLGKRIMPSP
ncbi:pentapeptide repeat-containing protein [Neisseria mucosa]|uniref:Pentapeptide repeat-containing protein n=1 Tax=Neisseria mucosa TaxID=488 RepID=A0AAW6Z4N5_NEIMU|nr:pentapeptide repeat-containing protein [Neisseria mucosa]MDK6725613.1 pentapeptide repeat-containing protein [Neisseria mucosa]MDK6870003.1 pentapeptide repeat-containing protein [Neisseria mucosa]MDK8109588.1 pentapeptide repeat-containing protein [Neisseria mucosa]MDK8360871.1 pentapeptide repeat-containing protein [Neisseria mucosa]